MEIGLDLTCGYFGAVRVKKVCWGRKFELISFLLSSNFISSSPRTSYTKFSENIVQLYSVTIMQLLLMK